jgi:hypothetical protein
MLAPSGVSTNGACAGCAQLRERIVALEQQLAKSQAPQQHICVVDGDDVATSQEGTGQSDRREFSSQRLLTAITELHTKGFENLIIFVSRDLSESVPQHQDRILWKQVGNYNSRDLVTCAADNRCRILTNNETRILQDDWRLPPYVREFLKAIHRPEADMLSTFRWNSFGHFGVRRIAAGSSSLSQAAQPAAVVSGPPDAAPQAAVHVQPPSIPKAPPKALQLAEATADRASCSGPAMVNLVEVEDYALKLVAHKGKELVPGGQSRQVFLAHSFHKCRTKQFH